MLNSNLQAAASFFAPKTNIPDNTCYDTDFIAGACDPDVPESTDTVIDREPKAASVDSSLSSMPLLIASCAFFKPNSNADKVAETPAPDSTVVTNIGLAINRQAFENLRSLGAKVDKAEAIAKEHGMPTQEEVSEMVKKAIVEPAVSAHVVSPLPENDFDIVGATEQISMSSTLTNAKTYQVFAELFNNGAAMGVDDEMEVNAIYRNVCMATGRKEIYMRTRHHGIIIAHDDDAVQGRIGFSFSDDVPDSVFKYIACLNGGLNFATSPEALQAIFSLGQLFDAVQYPAQ